ncbi:hypothetical protein ACIA78_31795 [Streptomyces xanthochromogenes]
MTWTLPAAANAERLILVRRRGLPAAVLDRMAGPGRYAPDVEALALMRR